MEIKTVWITTRPPTGGGDFGAVEGGHYRVVDGVVVMCDEAGKPTGQKRKLEAGQDPHHIAARLMREAWIKQADRSDFNRPLVYGPSGVV
jgi:hypothetical protein